MSAHNLATRLLSARPEYVSSLGAPTLKVTTAKWFSLAMPRGATGAAGAADEDDAAPLVDAAMLPSVAKGVAARLN